MHCITFCSNVFHYKGKFQFGSCQNSAYNLICVFEDEDEICILIITLIKKYILNIFKIEIEDVRRIQFFLDVC